MTDDLVVEARDKTLTRGLVKTGAIIHSDRGSQYPSSRFRKLLEINNLRQSMSGRGNCYDNAHTLLGQIQNRTARRRLVRIRRAGSKRNL